MEAFANPEHSIILQYRVRMQGRKLSSAGTAPRSLETSAGVRLFSYKPPGANRNPSVFHLNNSAYLQNCFFLHHFLIMRIVFINRYVNTTKNIYIIIFIYKMLLSSNTAGSKIAYTLVQ